MKIDKLIRPDLIGMKAYSSARDEFEGVANIFLDANENPNQNGVNRYPDPMQSFLKTKIATIKGVSTDFIFLGNGSDECIDLLFRLFCILGKDEVAAMSPSYGMYAVSARINAVGLREILLDEDFTFPTQRLLQEAKGTKMLFLCSPNNPTGFTIPKTELKTILENYEGIVILDEAYIDFAQEKGMLEDLENYPNLVICQTFSKAYGLAGIRLGLLFGSKEIITWLNKIKPPYNINSLTQEFALNYLEKSEQIQEQIQEIKQERKQLEEKLLNFQFVKQVFPSEANFILVRVEDATNLYDFLIEKKIVVRNRSNQPLCQNTLRFTIGTPQENQLLIAALNLYNQ